MRAPTLSAQTRSLCNVLTHRYTRQGEKDGDVLLASQVTLSSPALAVELAVYFPTKTSMTQKLVDVKRHRSNLHTEAVSQREWRPSYSKFEAYILIHCSNGHD